MRLLIIADPGVRENHRLVEEGRRAGHLVDLARIEELTFDVGNSACGAILNGRSIFTAYDTLYLRYFYPYFSEALLLAEWAKKSGLRVIDRALAEGNFVYSKVYDAWRLAEAGLPVPDGFQVMKLKNAEARLQDRRWPVVAKGVHGSQGRYVFQMKNLTQARKSLNKDLVGFFTFQECLPIREEYRGLVIGGKFVGAMKKVRPESDFRHNLAVGAVGERAELPRSLSLICERAARVLNREFAGVDLAIAEGKPYILEVNRRPGFIGFEEATGINVAEIFIKYVAQNRDRRIAQRRQIDAVPSHHQEAG